MKKIMILLAAVALMATTACNEKPAKEAQTKEIATEKAEAKAEQPSTVKVSPLDKPQPTEDGKDHTVAEFNTKEYQVKVENLADGTYRVTLSKDGKAEQVYATKNCRVQGKACLMHTDDGKNILINGDKGQIVIMNKKEIIYKGSK